jgi:hypothetical protein
MAQYTNKGPRMVDLAPFYQAGVNPKTGLPLKFGDCGDGTNLKSDIKRTLRIIDEQNAVNRFKWTNLPCNITGQELERLLYYRGQLCFFFDKATKMFYFMPYALDGPLDFYGRYTYVKPVPFVEPGDGASADEKRAHNVMKAYLSQKHLRVLYDIPSEPIEDLESVCLLLHDYTKQYSQTIIPRQELNDGILDVMSDCIPFMRTNLLNSTGITGVIVSNQDEAANVELASEQVNKAAIKGKKYVPLMGSPITKDLTGGNLAKSEEFLLAMQGLDNYRLSLYGLDNGGIFQKRSGMLQEEAEMNQGNVGMILQDSLQIRQNFCNMANLIWIMRFDGPLVWCDVSETVIGMDLNGDGKAGGDETQPSQTAKDTSKEDNTNE